MDPGIMRNQIAAKVDFCNTSFAKPRFRPKKHQKKQPRNKFGIKTKYRQLGTNYGSHENTFLGEYEEVVTSCNSFSYEDFLEIRNLNFMYYTVFSLNFQRWFFHFIRRSGVKLSEFFLNFIKPDRSESWPEGYIKFLDDLKATIEGELHDKPSDVIKKANNIYHKNNNDHCLTFVPSVFGSF